MHKNVHQVILLLPTLNLIKFLLNLLKLALKSIVLLLKLFLLGQSITPSLQRVGIALALLYLLEEYLQVVDLLREFVLGCLQFLYPIIGLVMFLPVFLKVSIEIDREIEGKLMLVLHCLSFLPIEFGSVDVHEQIFRFISDESCLLLETTVDFDLEVELLVQGFVETACARVEDDACEVTDYRRLFLHALVIVVLDLCPVEQLLDGSLPRVEDRIESLPVIALVLDDGGAFPCDVLIEERF